MDHSNYPAAYQTAINNVEATWNQMQAAGTAMSGPVPVPAMTISTYKLDDILGSALEAGCAHLAEVGLAIHTHCGVGLNERPMELAHRVIHLKRHEKTDIRALASAIWAQMPTQSSVAEAVRIEVGGRLKSAFWAALDKDVVVKQGRPVLAVHTCLDDIQRKYGGRAAYSYYSRDAVRSALQALLDAARLGGLISEDDAAGNTRFINATSDMMENLMPRARTSHALIDVVPTHKRCDFLLEPALAEQVSALIAEASAN